MVEGLKTIVFHAGCSYRQRLEAFLAEMGIMTAKPLAFGSIDAILSCVAAGIGVSLLPKGVVAAAWRDGAVSVHELPPGKRKWTPSSSGATMPMFRVRSPLLSRSPGPVCPRQSQLKTAFRPRTYEVELTQ